MVVHLFRGCLHQASIDQNDRKTTDNHTDRVECSPSSKSLREALPAKGQKGRLWLDPWRRHW
jgi:hypothetical protein